MSRLEEAMVIEEHGCVNCGGKRKLENCDNCNFDPTPEKKQKERVKKKNIWKIRSEGDLDDDSSSEEEDLCSEEEDDYEDDYEYRWYDDDDDGDRDMTKEEGRIYAKQLYKTDGFYVDEVKGTNTMLGQILPITSANKACVVYLSHFARVALLDYNTQNGTNWEFSKIIHVNVQAASGLRYYISFKANKDNAAHQIFQAMVSTLCEKIDVELIRPKPTKTKNFKAMVLARNERQEAQGSERAHCC